MLKAVIFDVDGTLVDSVDFHAQAWVDAFSDYGHKVGFQEVRAQIGKGGDQLMPVFLSTDEIAATGKNIEEHRGKILKDRYLPRIKAFPDVRALLERLIANGTKVALASSAKEDELATYKRIATIEDIVQVQTSSSDAEKSKPHPDIFEAVLQRMEGVYASEAIVVGDTPYDAEAASKAGLRTVGLLCGGWPEDALMRAGCIAVYEDPADLLARFDTSPLAS